MSASSNTEDFQNALKGIINPEFKNFEAGKTIWKFASSLDPKTGQQRTSDQWMASPWWLDADDFMAIYNRGRDPNRGASADRDRKLSCQARQDLAVLNNWSRMDRIVKATIKAPWYAYAGSGAPQNVNEPDWPWLQMTPDANITQLYICNLNDLRHKNLMVEAGVYTLDVGRMQED